MRTCWMVLLAMAAGCPPAAKDPAPPRIDIAATALATLDRDASSMLELVRAVFEESRVSVANNLSLELGNHDGTRASYDDTEIRIAMPAPANSPDEAGAFWKAQGALTGGWDGEGFADDIEKARLARFAAFTTLAREVGEFLVYAYVGPVEPAQLELLADRLAAALLDRLAVRPELADLFTRYRALLARWHKAIPDDRRVELPAADAELDQWVASHPLPEEPAAAAALAVARQLRVFAKPPKLDALVNSALLAPYRARLSKVDYAPAKLVVTTGRDVPTGFGVMKRPSGTLRELVASLLDADGKFHGIRCNVGACDYTNEAGATTKLALANVLGGELAEYGRVHDVAIVGDKLWLLLGGDNQRAALAILDVTRPDALKPTATWQPVAAGRLAASPSGAVSVLLLRAGGWAVERFEGTGKSASWTFKVANGGDADGKNGSAGGALGDCTSSDAGTIYCTAGVRIRVVDKDRIATLAGSNRDWVDAVDQKKVAFTSPVRVRATKDGLVLVDRKYADDGKASWKVREIALKK